MQKCLTDERVTPDPFAEWTKLPPLWQQIVELRPPQSTMMAEVLGRELFYYVDGTDQRRYDVRIRAVAVGKVLLKRKSIYRPQLVKKIGFNFSDKGTRFLKANKFLKVQMIGTAGHKGYTAIYSLTTDGRKWVQKNLSLKLITRR